MPSPNPHPSLPGRLALRLAAATVLAAAFPPPAAAADNAWTNGAGTFAWNATAANRQSPSVATNSPLFADAAGFGSTGVGTVNLTGTINARSLNFAADGHTLAGGTLNLVNSGSGTLGPGTVNVGATSA